MVNYDIEITNSEEAAERLKKYAEQLNKDTNDKKEEE